MPFKSRAQARYLFAKHPEVAEEFAATDEADDAAPSLLGGRHAVTPPSSCACKFRISRSWCLPLVSPLTGLIVMGPSTDTMEDAIAKRVEQRMPSPNGNFVLVVLLDDGWLACYP